jgi:hypothetical protein
MRKWQFAQLLSIVVVALPLLVSALRHWENPFAFLSTIYSYRIVGSETGRVLSLVLPVVQMVLATAILFFAELRSRAFLMSAGLFALFSVVQIYTVRRGLNISCGCFGNDNNNPIGAVSIAIAVSCMFAATLGWQASCRLDDAKTAETFKAGVTDA